MEDTHNRSCTACPALPIASGLTIALPAGKEVQTLSAAFQHLFVPRILHAYSHFVPWPTAAGQTCKIGTLKALLHLKRFKTLSSKNRWNSWNWWNDEEQCIHTAFTDIQTFQVPASQTPLQPSMDRKLPSSHCSPGWASITAALSRCQRWTPHVENERNDEKCIFLSYNVLPWLLPFLLLHVSILFHTKHPCHSITTNGTAHRPEDCSLCCGGITSVSGQFQLWSILNCSAWTLRSYKDIKLTKVNLNTAILQRKKDRCGNLDHETCWGDCLLHRCRRTRGPTGPGNYRRNPTKPQITATLSSQVRNHSVQDTRDTLIKTLRYTVYTLKRPQTSEPELSVEKVQNSASRWSRSTIFASSWGELEPYVIRVPGKDDNVQSQPNVKRIQDP